MFVGIATLLLIVWGVWSALRLPIDAVPDITNNQIQIITSAPSLATQEVEQLVTAPIERALGNIPGRIEMRSISRFGLSVITLVFEDSMDDYKARALVQEHLQQVASELPEAVSKPELAPMSTGLGEVYQYMLLPKEEGKYSAMELRSLQDWVVARGLNGTKGVAEINGFGGELKQYEVSIDPNRLRSLGLTLTMSIRLWSRAIKIQEERISIRSLMLSLLEVWVWLARLKISDRLLSQMLREVLCLSVM